MGKVYNWQINRDMSYPYDGKYPERQFAAVFNINRCIACQTCTMACKSTWTFSKGQELMWWNNVETKPYGGYPQYWDVKLLNLMQKAHDRQKKSMTWNSEGTYDGMTIFEAAEKEKTQNGQSRVLGYLPKDHEWTKPNIGEDVSPPKSTKKDKMGYIPDPIKLPEHKSFFFYLQRICNHCTYPACLAACPRKAIYKRDEDGVVLIDQERCRGYRKCVEACPYKKIYLNHQTGITEKCIFCFPRIENGVAPACARQCPGRLRFVGYTDDMEAPIGKLIHKWKVAIPLHPEYGTEPNVFYVPPIAPSLLDKDGNLDDSKPRIPNDYLVSLFGPTVLDALVVLKEEMAKRKKGEASELMDILIAYDWKEMFGGFDRNPETIEWLEDSE